ncbi:MAG: hypothetical protein JNJ76_07445 [Candidatus Competibacter sp.]|nr:hypothetical protein [Candidatus Competibacter sp.]
MATALVYPDAKKGGDRKSSSFNKLDHEEFSKASLSQARFVLRNCRDKAEEVLRNPHYPLTKAYEEPWSWLSSIDCSNDGGASKISYL